MDKRTLLQGDGLGRKAVSSLPVGNARGRRRPGAILQERGITAESIERFRWASRRWNAIGFCGRPKETAVRPKGGARIGRRLLETIGILARPAEGGSYYDRFRGRLLFSIHDAQGRPVGIGGRVLPELGSTSPAKYVNSPETPLFTKSKLLYGLDLAREALRKTAHGAGDGGLHRRDRGPPISGSSNAVAVLGTALGESHIRILKRHADRIVLVLDGDEAGTKRANEVLELFVAAAGRPANPHLARRARSVRLSAQVRGGGVCRTAGHQGGRCVGSCLRGEDPRASIWSATCTAPAQALEELIAIVAKAPRLRHDTTRDARFREEKILQRLAARFRVDEREVAAAADGAAPPKRGRQSGDKAAIAGRATAASYARAGRDASRPRGDRCLAARIARTAGGPSRMPRSARSRIEAARLAAGPCRRIYETCCRLADEGVIAYVRPADAGVRRAGH